MVSSHGCGLLRRMSQDRTVSIAISISFLVPLLLRVFVVQLRFLVSLVSTLRFLLTVATPPGKSVARSQADCRAKFSDLQLIL